MEAKPLVLIVDDDAELSAMVVELLGREGWSVHTVLTGGDGERALATLRPDAVLLDVMLPDANGYELCRRWRAAQPGLGLLMFTARGDPMDRVLGLEIGADDYLAKPFEPRELLARVRAVLRRFKGAAPRGGGEGVLRFGRLSIDAGARSVRIDGEERQLTAYQFDLLLAMAQGAGRVLSREQLMDAVKGEALEAFDRSIDVHIARIRAAIEDDARKPKRIVTVRGAGYVFAKVQDA